MTWEWFLTLFQEKYLGQAILSRKVWEFFNLRQGTMSVAVYVSKFDELALFSPTMVPTDSAQKMKSIHGLRIDIVQQVEYGRMGPETYSNAVQRALRYDGQKEVVGDPIHEPIQVNDFIQETRRSNKSFNKRKHERRSSGSRLWNVSDDQEEYEYNPKQRSWESTLSGLKLSPRYVTSVEDLTHVSAIWAHQDNSVVARRATS